MLLLRKLIFLLFLAVPAACAGRRAPPPPPPPPPPVVEVEPVAPPFPHPFVWTMRTDQPIRTESGEVVVPYLFSRLEVLGNDSLGLRVRCSFCPVPVEGWVSPEQVVYEPTTPDLAAHRGLAEFLLAVRDAAARRDLEALQPVMVRNFIAAFDGAEGPEDAITRWRWEGFRSLDQLPALLDRGVSTRDRRIWAAPPQYLNELNYRELRAGFWRAGDRWEWLFLVSGY